VHGKEAKDSKWEASDGEDTQDSRLAWEWGNAYCIDFMDEQVIVIVHHGQHASSPSFGLLNCPSTHACRQRYYSPPQPEILDGDNIVDGLHGTAREKGLASLGTKNK
jgi:hypothetical protein